MQLTNDQYDAAILLDRIAAEERLLSRNDSPARPLLLEPWEADLLLHLAAAWRDFRPPVADGQGPRPTIRSVARFQDLQGLPGDETYLAAVNASITAFSDLGSPASDVILPPITNTTGGVNRLRRFLKSIHDPPH